MMRILGTIFAGLFGLAFGSFLNVCLSRWPEGESIVQPASHCRNCSHTLSWWENIPLFSWLALRGRCRECRTWIGWRYPLVEAAVGLLWALITWRFILGWFPLLSYLHTGGLMLFAWLLVALAVLDAEHLWLPDLLTIPGIFLGILWWLLHGELIGLALGMPWEKKDLEQIGLRILGILTAAGLILLIRWIYKLIRKQEGLGLGDAKLMALLAAWLGLPLTMVAFVIGVLLGSVAAMVLLARPSLQREGETWALSKLPLGTFLCIGGIVSSLCGQPILNAYLRWAGF
jgi:leader peptidase (prepilin peptidase)/N-methyltransferase